MIQRLAAAAVLLPLFLLSVLYLPSMLFITLVDVFLGLAAFELLRILKLSGVRPYELTYPLLLLLPWIWSYRPEQVLLYLIFTGLLSMCRSLFRNRDLHRAGLDASANLMVIVYLGIPFSIAADLQNQGSAELLLLLSVIWTGDTAAFLVGRRWGRHKVTPGISPQKSLEGFIAGFSFSVLAAFLLGSALLPGWSDAHLVSVGLLLGLTGPLGDLFESLLKRGANIKDSSVLIPGHGGILDRTDSLLFALPAYYLLTVLIK